MKVKEVNRVDTYSLVEFCAKVQELIKDGWEFDFDTNENVPISYGSMLTAGMVKSLDEQVVTADVKGPVDLGVEDTVEDTPVVAVKRGRKPKN